LTLSLKKDFRTVRYLKATAAQFLVSVGAIAAVLGLYDVFYPDQISELAGTGVLVGVVALVSIAFAVWRTWPRPIQQSFTKPNTEVHIVPGDLFARDGHVMIGMADTFDTQINDPEVIQPSSVQGQFLLQIYNGERAALDTDLDAALAGAIPLGTINKSGKTTRFPMGTVATVRRNGRTYFCLAYTSMDENNNARATVGGIWNCLGSLWDVVRRDANGGTIAVPVIGGGQARIAQHLPAQDAIRLIALSFVLASRVEKVCDRLDIIVLEKEMERLNAPELQAFLRSLDEA
jgi:hypothetical protein